jgi:hypothetical protein
VSSLEGNGGTLLFRVTQLERQLGRLEDWRSDDVDPQRATQTEQMRQLIDNMRQLSAEVRGLRRTIMTIAISIATSSVGFGLAILAATGKIG